jgi:hypothetical protein
MLQGSGGELLLATATRGLRGISWRAVFATTARRRGAALAGKLPLPRLADNSTLAGGRRSHVIASKHQRTRAANLAKRGHVDFEAN